jgi:hypothetical protein
LATKFNAKLIVSRRGQFDRRFLSVVSSLRYLMASPISRRLAEKAKWFELVLGTDRPKPTWRSVLDFPVDALAQEARSADLAVIGPMLVPGDSYCCLSPGEAILRLGRPALFVPTDVSSLRAEHVVIA